MGAIEQLAELDANWIDETGAARIETASGLFVLRDPSEDAAGSNSTLGFRWAASAVEIAELLLARPPEGIFGASQLAEQSGWSPAQMSKLLSQFSARSWVEKVGGSRGVGSGWRLVDPAALLDAWTQHLAAHRPRRCSHIASCATRCNSRTRPARALSPRMPWALSGWAGLEIAAPRTTVPVIHVAVEAKALDSRLRDAMRAASCAKSMSARVASAPPPSFSHSATQCTLPVVSAPRLYADLHALGGRGEEAAHHVREELLLCLTSSSSAHQRPAACRERLVRLLDALAGHEPDLVVLEVSSGTPHRRTTRDAHLSTTDIDIPSPWSPTLRAISAHWKPRSKRCRTGSEDRRLAG